MEVTPTSWFYDINGKVTFRTKKDVFSLSTYSGQDRLDNTQNNNAAGFGLRGGGPPGGGGGAAAAGSNLERSVVDQSDWGNTGASLDLTESFLNSSGISKGVEFLLQKKAGPLTGWLSYTPGRVEYEFDAYGENVFPASHDVNHEGKIVALYQPERSKFTFGATLIYATGKPYTAPLGAYTIELLDGSTQDLFAASNKNSLRLPDYHRLDLSVNYDLGRFLGGRAKTSFSLFNAYNRKNVWYKEYDVVDGQILETNVNLLGLTPSLGFNWSFR